MIRRLIVFHSLNDYSGSPNILASVLRGLILKGYSIDLYTSSEQGGCLSNLRGVNYHTVFYRFTKNRLLTFFRFIILQYRYFMISVGYKKTRDAAFYINTIMPFGAVVAGRLINIKIIYHVHENPVIKNVIHKIAIKIFLKYSDKAFFVSKYLFDSYNMDPERKILVYNALSPEFTLVAKAHQPEFQAPFNILMVSSLKKYKGVDTFLDLALNLSQFNFCLVLNASIVEIKNYFKNRDVPANISFFPGMGNLQQFYGKAHLVVNLSLPELFIESFGLTILEALTYGIPVIVPPVGGIIEMVENGVNGYKIDPCNEGELIGIINKVFSDEKEFFRLSKNARQIAKKFSFDSMISKIEHVLLQY